MRFLLVLCESSCTCHWPSMPTYSVSSHEAGSFWWQPQSSSSHWCLAISWCRTSSSGFFRLHQMPTVSYRADHGECGTLMNRAVDLEYKLRIFIRVGGHTPDGINIPDMIATVRPHMPGCESWGSVLASSKSKLKNSLPSHRVGQVRPTLFVESEAACKGSECGPA